MSMYCHASWPGDESPMIPYTLNFCVADIVLYIMKQKNYVWEKLCNESSSNNVCWIFRFAIVEIGNILYIQCRASLWIFAWRVTQALTLTSSYVIEYQMIKRKLHLHRNYCKYLHKINTIEFILLSISCEPNSISLAR